MLAVAFGGGFATDAYINARAAATVAVHAAKAQEKHDVAQHTAAVKAGATVAAGDAAQAPRIITITKTIHDLEPDPNKICNLPDDVAKQLTAAGSYTGK